MFHWFKEKQILTVYQQILNYCRIFKKCINDYNKQNIDKLKKSYEDVVKIINENYKKFYDYCVENSNIQAIPIFDIFEEFEKNLNNNCLKNQKLNQKSFFDFNDENNDNYIFGDLHGDFSVLIQNLELKRTNKIKNLFLLGDIFDPFNNEFIKSTNDLITKNKIIFAANNEIFLFYFLMMLMNVFNYNIIWVLGNHDLNYGFMYFFSFYFFFYGFQPNTNLNIITSCNIKIREEIYHISHEPNNKAVNNNLIFYQLKELMKRSIYYKHFQIKFNHDNEFKNINEQKSNLRTLTLQERNKIYLYRQIINEIVLDLSDGMIEFENKTQLNYDVNEIIVDNILKEDEKPFYILNKNKKYIKKKFEHKNKNYKHIHGHTNVAENFEKFLNISRTKNITLLNVEEIEYPTIPNIFVKNNKNLTLDTTISYFKNSNIRQPKIKKMLENKIKLSQTNDDLLINEQTGYLWFIHNNSFIYKDITVLHYILNSLFFKYQENKEFNFGGKEKLIISNRLLKNEKELNSNKTKNKGIIKLSNIRKNIKTSNINQMNNTLLKEDIELLNDQDFRFNVHFIYYDNNEIIGEYIEKYKDYESSVMSPLSNIFDHIINPQYDKKAFEPYYFNFVNKNNKPIYPEVYDELKQFKFTNLKYGNIEIFNKPEIIHLIDTLTPKINFLIEYVNMFKCHINYDIPLGTCACSMSYDYDKKFILTDEEDSQYIYCDLLILFYVMMYYIFMPYHKLNIEKDNKWFFSILYLLTAYFSVFINKDNRISNKLKPQLNNKLAVLYCNIHNWILFNVYKIKENENFGYIQSKEIIPFRYDKDNIDFYIDEYIIDYGFTNEEDFKLTYDKWDYIKFRDNRWLKLE